jgi:hypothetical protein
LFDCLSGACFDALAAEYAFVEVDLGALFAIHFNYGNCFGGAVSFADSTVGSTHGFDVESEVFSAFKVDFVAGFYFVDEFAAAVRWQCGLYEGVFASGGFGE